MKEMYTRKNGWQFYHLGGWMESKLIEFIHSRYRQITK